MTLIVNDTFAIGLKYYNINKCIFTSLNINVVSSHYDTSLYNRGKGILLITS